MENIICCSQINHLADITKFGRYFLNDYYFRGQSDYNWDLTTSIERLLANENANEMFRSLGYGYVEMCMLKEFYNKIHLYDLHYNSGIDNVSMLSVMQHFGAATRLLDFSNSIYIALYFSVIDACSDSSIWAIHKNTTEFLLHKKAKLNYNENFTFPEQLNDHHIAFANDVIARSCNFANRKTEMENLIVSLTPHIFNHRNAVQQGCFLFPTNCKRSFMENFYSFYGLDECRDNVVRDITEICDNGLQVSTPVVVKIKIPRSIHSAIIEHLKSMNITAETLFPGLEGLAKALNENFKNIRGGRV